MKNILFKKEWRKCSICHQRIGWMFCGTCAKQLDKEALQEEQIKGRTLTYQELKAIIKRMEVTYASI